MIVVSDASPLINLVIIGHLNVLQQLYGRVIVPQAVYDEVVIKGAGQPGAMEVAQADWIDIKPITNRPLVTSIEGELDKGESEAIVLAVELKATLLLIDDQKGRVVANRLGVNSIGLLGVLIKAKHEGMVTAVASLMDELRSKAGFWIADDLYYHILQVAGEEQ
ncbi:MAG: DUF3368 domain-containing protein [Chloroflexota bacterium]|nr:MAG: DUF3368 domain-containing protein [Chloroflexota bacterium]